MKKKYAFLIKKQCLFLLLFALFILFAEHVHTQPASQTFNTSGTYVIPSGYSAILTIEAWGGGGGGGTNSGNAKGGGGGGAYASITTNLAAGSYTVTVGGGGAVATAGGNSSFTSLVIAAGGSSTTTATGGAGGTTAASTGTTLFAGGNGGNGAASGGTRGGGGGGGSATSIANGGIGNNGTTGGVGGTGGTGNGAGGRGADASGTPDAVAGSTVGGGGGGRGSGGTSQIGAAGQVIVTVNSILPVKLGNITAFEKLSGIQIDWTVYSEENLDRYELERSDNGRSFIVIGNVASLNSVTETKYSWFDVHPLPGVSFYRLKSIDIDGKFGYSSVIKVNLSKSVKEVSVYPNPVSGNYVSLQLSDLQKGNYFIKLFSSTGQQLYSKGLVHNGGAITQALQLPQTIHPGIYVLQLVNDGLKLMSKSLMIQ